MSTGALTMARSYRAGGLSVVPILADGTKVAAVEWKPYQERLPSEQELQRWFGNGSPRGVAIVYGPVSGNAECIDFDDAELYEPFAVELNNLAPGLLDRLTMIRTPRPGCHLVYRCEAVEGNQQLAMGIRGDKQKAIIETRGTGGYALAPGCPLECNADGKKNGTTYQHASGPPLSKLPTIATEERAILFRVARSLNEIVDEEPTPRASDGNTSGVTPGDDFNKRATWEGILQPQGWAINHARGNVTYWRRPGKEVGWSATSGNVSKAGNEVFCCFSDNAHPFQGANGVKPCSTYTKFAAYATLHHNGDYAAAAKELARKGYGEKRERQSKHQSEQNGWEPEQPTHKPIERFTFAELRNQYPTMKPVVVDGLLREGETCNVISTSKIGKSWLGYGLALSIITGRDWLGQFVTTPGKVLIVDNELHRETISHRIPAVADALGIHAEQFDLDLEIWPLRGNLRSLHELGEQFDRIEEREFKLIILDAKYRFATGTASENDNAAETQIYNLLDRYAERTKAAFVLIHHGSKGSQSDKRTTDVGAGAGAQSRAADCHLVLREHEEEGVVVLEAAVRSFKPVEPLALRWNYPLWVPASGVDPGKLKGRGTKQQEQQSERDKEATDKILAALRDKPATARQLRETTGLSRERQQRLLDWLVSEGHLTPKTIAVKGKDCREYTIKIDAI